jgi:mRNA-degrading endonuclease YafQ of YafQ-DinJ toxin-antitoxin module
MKRFVNDFKKGLFTDEDGTVIRTWVTEMETFGPRYIENNPDWRDHALYGEWIGYRASCFSSSGRIVYKIIDEEQIEVCLIERITPDHDYKR